MKSWRFPANINNKTRAPTLPTLIQHSTGIPSQRNQVRKSNKFIQIRKKKVKLSLLTDDILLYIENPKDSIKKKPVRTNK